MRRDISFEQNTRVNSLTILEKDTSLPNNHWRCRCDCGNVKSIKATELDRKRIKSCGCVHGFPHKYVNTPLYRSWYHMKDRCSNKNNKDFSYYGGRDISYCNEWKKFPTFRDWAITNGFEKGLTLDRINADGNYEPNNCRWVTRLIQAQNQRRSIKFKGEIASDASRRLGGSDSLVTGRLKNGWSLQRAFTEEVRTY